MINYIASLISVVIVNYFKGIIIMYTFCQINKLRVACFNINFRIREAIKVEKKKKSVTFVTHLIRGHCHTFYFMLKMAYNSSRNAKKILGRGGANPLNCHTKWGGDQKKKCDKCHTFFFFLLWRAPLFYYYYLLLALLDLGLCHNISIYLFICRHRVIVITVPTATKIISQL